VLKIGTRAEFETLKNTSLEKLTDRDDRLMNQFLNGLTSGPLTDEHRLSEYRRLLVPTEETRI
jgi:hypothetical protein